MESAPLNTVGNDKQSAAIGQPTHRKGSCLRKTFGGSSRTPSMLLQNRRAMLDFLIWYSCSVDAHADRPLLGDVGRNADLVLALCLLSVTSTY